MTSRALSHPEEFLILCVEDERSLRDNIVEELQDAGYQVLGADDGQSALDLLGDRQPDLILCDITMPRMGGFELLRAVRGMGPDMANVPFVFLTALSDRLAVIEGKTAGADDYLSKPIDFDVMLATVRARLDQVVRITTGLGSAAESQRQADLEAASRRSLGDLVHTLDQIALGVVLFDAQRDIIHQNHQAEAVMGETLFHSNGRLSSADSKVSQQLRTALDAALAESKSSDLIAVSEEGRHPVLVRFVALGSQENGSTSAAMLLLDTQAPPPISEALTARLFALTPTEARVAASLARGLRTDEVALDMGITATTLAFHMRNIFRKAGVGRQQDLVALIFRGALLVDAPTG
jgi:DNA-binding NarL/FixJ family response regulator